MKKNDWINEEKHYITKQELIEFAKMIWCEASGVKPDKDIIKYDIEGLANEEMLRMWHRDHDWKI